MSPHIPPAGQTLCQARSLQTPGQQGQGLVSPLPLQPVAGDKVVGTKALWELPAVGQVPTWPPPAAERGAVLGMAPAHRTCSVPPLRRPLRDVGGSAPKQTLGGVQISTSARRGRGCSEGVGQDPAPPGLAAGSLPAGRSRRAAQQWVNTARCWQEPSGAPPQEQSSAVNLHPLSTRMQSRDLPWRPGQGWAASAAIPTQL